METVEFLKICDWNKIIKTKAHIFKEYLRKQIGDRYYSLLEELSKDVDIFIFSGIIKDYLLDIQEKPRDIDFTFRGKPQRKWGKIIMENFEVTKNRFGGFKLRGRGSIDCDVWDIERTYGITKRGLRLRPNDLLDMVFFNFTSIVYDFKSERFIYDLRFLEFLRTMRMEVVNEKNPDIELCFVNIYHNFKKYGIEPGFSVIEWAKENYEESLWFRDVQQRHFHKELYTQVELLNFISSKLLK